VYIHGSSIEYLKRIDEKQHGRWISGAAACKNSPRDYVEEVDARKMGKEER
jgi:hypothetical protein